MKTKNNKLSIAFYNTENLFDIYDDKEKLDNAFLPDADRKWTEKRYKNKLRKLSFSISEIGHEITGKHPAVVGLAEVENKRVLRDLLDAKHLKELPYDFVHYDSPDERGIDVALIYDTDQFEVITSETFLVEILDEDFETDHTRDILLVTGKLNGEIIHVIVNHWPSRRKGADETAYKRLTASNKVLEIIASIKNEDENAMIIVMGDFNDEPESNSITRLTEKASLYNTVKTLKSFNRGSLSYDFKWNLFDQILISNNFFDPKNALQFEDAEIFDVDFLKLFNGPYKGSPFRTYVGKKYKGGYSDHFPVFILLEKINSNNS